MSDRDKEFYMEKYCIVLSNYLPNMGGIEMYGSHLAKYLEKEGKQIIIVTANVFQLEEEEQLTDNIKIYRLPCWNLMNGRFPVIKLNYHSFIKKIKEENIDYYIINARWYHISYIMARLSKKMKKSSIVIEHGTNHLILNNRMLDKLAHIYDHFVTFFIKKLCSDFYGVSAGCCQWLSHFKIQTKGILYNAIDLEEIQQFISGVSITYKDKYKVEKDRVIITYAGRLLREKGVFKLIEAVKNIKNVTLFIAGDGPVYEEVKKMENENVIVLGRLQSNELMRLLAHDTDIFVFPTDYPEGFPTCILEAIACKCFVITTKNGGSKELIVNNDYGIILEENTIEEIRNKIEYVLENKQYREMAIENSYNSLLREFTFDKTTRKIIEQFEE